MTKYIIVAEMVTGKKKDMLKDQIFGETSFYDHIEELLKNGSIKEYVEPKPATKETPKKD